MGSVKRAALVQASIREIIAADSNRYGLDQEGTIRRAFGTHNMIALRDVDRYLIRTPVASRDLYYATEIPPP